MSLSFTGPSVEDIGGRAGDICGMVGVPVVEVKLGVGSACQGRRDISCRVSGSFVLISHSPLASGRLGLLLGKVAFHGRCVYQISPPKPAGETGDLEQTNRIEKANKPDHPNSIYPSLAPRLGLSRSHGPQLSFNP